MIFRPWSGAGRCASTMVMVTAMACGLPARAHAGDAFSLRQSFEAAWQRQPEALAGAARRDAAQAQLQAAQRLTPEPAAVEIAARTDRFNRNDGAREYVTGVAVPLWLPGERPRAQAVTAAERRAIDSRLHAAQLRLAGSVRDAWWGVHRARLDAALAQARLANAQQLTADVARRMQAGDLSRADRHQAEGALAAAQAAVAEATATQAHALHALRTLTGVTVTEPLPETPEPVPAGDLAEHPALRELQDRAEVARRSRELAGVQTRANPELSLSATRERGSFGEAYGPSLTLGLRIPFGSDSRQRARLATADAEQIEAESQLANERQRVQSEVEAARTRMDSARHVAEAAARRAELAHQTRGFYDKAFNLGEADLPTRLRVELEAFEAERLQVRARIELAQALSQWRQALGLLPE